MSNCNITIRLGKETKTFTSDAELDQYLNSRASELKRLYKIKDVEQFDKVFSLTEAQGEAVSKIDDITKAYQSVPKKIIRTPKEKLGEHEIIKDLDEYDYADYIEGSLSVSKGVETFGNPHDVRKPVVSGVNTNYEAEFRRLRAAEGKNPAEIQEAWERQEFKGRLSAKVGDDIHYIMDIKFQQLSDPSVKIDLSKLSVLTPEDYLKYEPIFNAKVQRIKEKYPGATFYTEFSIISKDLPSSVKRAIKTQLNRNVDTINGRMDLLIVDTSGKCHIVDWKTANKHIGRLKEEDNSILAKNNWWHSTKKRKALAQVGWYGAMLEQYGLEVEDMVLECFYVDFTTDEKGLVIKGVTNIEEDEPIMDQNGGGRSTAPLASNYRSAARYQFGVTKPITLDKLIKTGEALNQFFPGTNISAELTKRKDADLNHYLDRSAHFWKEVDKSSDEYKEKGYRYYFYPKYLPDERIKRFYKTYDELKEGIAKYVEELNKSHLTEMSDFAKNLAAVIANGGRDATLMEQWLANFTPNTKDWLKQQFMKYYENGWDLFINEELNSNGIFIFKKADRIDVVCITSEDLYAPIAITHKSGKKAHNILGATLLDGEQGTDEINTMSSLYANLMYMKVATILANNPGILNGEAKFSGVSILNPWRRQIPPAPTRSYLCHNYNNLISKHSNLGLKVLSESMFYDDVDVAISEAGEALLATDIDWAGELLGADGSTKYHNMEHILRQMKRLRIAYPSEFENVKTRAGFAYYQLRLALLYANGIHPFLELDRGQYFNRGVLPTGLKINQASDSTSINFRNAAKTMIPMFRERYTNEFTKIANPFIKLCQEVYKEWGVTETSVVPRKFWENLFVKDGNGNVSKDMILKRPSSSEFTDKPKTRQLLQLFADTLAEARFRNLSDEELDRIKGTDEYWQVPLIPGSLGQYIETSFKEGGIAQVAKGLWQKTKDAADRFQNYYSEYATWEKQFYKNQDVSREDEVAYNPLIDVNQQQREELIYGKDGKSSSRVWSTDLRWIFLCTLERITLTNASRQFGPVFIAYLAALNYSSEMGNLDNREIIQAMTDYIENRVFLKDIMDPSLKWWRGVLSVAKSVSSKLTLGLSVRNITKEMLTQAYILATRNATGVIPDITSNEMWEAFSMVISNAPSSLSKQNFMTFLNQRYAMSNYGMHDRAEFLRKQHWGLLNLNSSDVFITTKIPDDYFRITVLIAKMKHDGCFDAYVEKDGTWVYDITKDKRFTRYLNNDMSDPVEYQKQKQLYEKYLAEWKKTYPELDWEQTSDRPFPSFPDAYPPSEKGALRTMTDELFGAFDGEDKSLLCATFLGSAFMQYKTWLSAKINQWMRAPGFVNIWQRFWNKDENGRRLYFVYATAEDLKNGMDEVRIINEDDPNLDKYLGAGQAVPWIIEEGTYQEGMLQAVGAFAKDILTWNIDDFKRHWENPITRGQMFNGLMDMFGLLLFAGLVKLMFGEDVVNNRKEQDWLTQWSYGALMGFAADGPIHQVFGGMLGDLNPPSLLALKQWAQTANSVLAGNKSIGQGLIETLGATREMRGYFYAMT